MIRDSLGDRKAELVCACGVLSCEGGMRMIGEIVSPEDLMLSDERKNISRKTSFFS